MAAARDCERALTALAARLADVDPELRRRHALDRTISVQVPDLNITWSGRLHEGSIVDVTREPRERAQIRLVVGSDDLLGLTSGELNFTQAWATGRLRMDANPLDLLRLRSLL